MNCYICHKKLKPENIHSFYKRMCTECGELNWQKREEYASLSGYIALITGGRIKIGYETALKLLRSGAYVIVTTRFPVDAVKRYSQEEDFNQWSQRLRIFQTDFRQLQNIVELVSYLYCELSHLDILINNAAQTVRYEYKYYEDLCEAERADYHLLPKALQLLIVTQKSSQEFIQLQKNLDSLLGVGPKELKAAYSVENKTIADSRIVNLISEQQNCKPRNSWNSKACEISLVELYEVQQINTTTPFLLCTSLRQLLEQSPHRYKYIINVSAMEGQFSKKNKNAFHPHTNMAKASLNMFTRTSAQDFIDSGILMNSVDTGWITDENPEWIREKNRKRGLTPPLDAKDGASRLCDPIFSSLLRDKHIFGSFLKDYTLTRW